MPYRALSHPYRGVAEPPRDEESLALACLAARARRARRAVGLPILAAGLVLGVLGGWLVRNAAFGAFDSRAPYITLLYTVFPLFVLAQAVAAYAGRKAVAARAHAWIAEIALAGGVCPSLLEAFAPVL